MNVHELLNWFGPRASTLLLAAVSGAVLSACQPADLGSNASAIESASSSLESTSGASESGTFASTEVNLAVAARPSSPAYGSLKKVFVYQGRYEDLFKELPRAQRFEATAQHIAKFDIITLTHAFTTGLAGTSGLDLGLKFNADANNRLESMCLDTRTDFDGDGRGDMARLIARIRQIRQGRVTKIFGYVPLTADALDCWAQTTSELIRNGNYMTRNPAGYENFVNWVQAWINLEHQNSQAHIDGFFLDMASEGYVHELGIASMVKYTKDVRGKNGRRYNFMPNVVDVRNLNLNVIGCWTWSNSAVSFIRLGPNSSNFCKTTNPISTFSSLTWNGTQLMGSGDTFLLEGFPLRAGSYLSGADASLSYLIPNELQLLKINRGIRWVTVSSELAYDPSCVSSTPIPGTTSQGTCQKTSSKVNCSSQNHATSIRLATSMGADGLFYTESNLGSISGDRDSFCAN